jgi:hypothetical protein
VEVVVVVGAVVVVVDALVFFPVFPVGTVVVVAVMVVDVSPDTVGTAFCPAAKVNSVVTT